MAIAIETEILLRLSLLVDESVGKERMFRQVSHHTLQLLGGIASVVMECEDGDPRTDPHGGHSFFSMPRGFELTAEFKDFEDKWAQTKSAVCCPPAPANHQTIQAAGLSFVAMPLRDFGHWVLVFAAAPPPSSFLRELGKIADRLGMAGRSLQRKARLDRARALERLHRQLAMSFLRPAGEPLPHKVDSALQEMGTHLAVCRAYVFQYDHEAHTTSNVFEWCAPGIPPQISHLQEVPMHQFPQWVRNHWVGKSMIIPDVLALDSGSPLRQLLEAQDIKSLLTIPMMEPERPWGFVGFDSVRTHTRWAASDASLLEVFAQLLLNAILREKQSQEMEQVQTDLKKSVAESRQLAARATELLEARTRFISLVSHEIRTPLTGLLGMVELLSTTELGSEQRAFLEAMERSGGLLRSTVDHLLDAARLEAGKVQLDVGALSCRQVLEDTASLFAANAREKGLELRVRASEELPPVVWGDEVRLRQALGNLVHNAIKFTEGGHVLVYGAYRLEEDEKPAEVVLGVEDTGIGFDTSEGAHLTELFWQGAGDATREGEGSGLGLAIVKELTRLMGGKLRFSSRRGEGTNVWMELPLPTERPPHDRNTHRYGGFHQVRGPDQGSPRPGGVAGLGGAKGSRTTGEECPACRPRLHQADSGSVPDRPARILVVDDDSMTRRVMMAQLRQLGLDGIPANDGMEALSTLRSQPIDAVVLDCHMPGLDGFQVLRALRRWKQKGGSPPGVVAASATISEVTETRALTAGASAFLRKPYSLSELHAALAEVLPMTG